MQPRSKNFQNIWSTYIFSSCSFIIICVMHCQTPPGCFFLSLSFTYITRVKQITASHNICSSLLKRILEAIDQHYWINTMSLSHFNFLDNKISLAQTNYRHFTGMRRGNSYERSLTTVKCYPWVVFQSHCDCKWLISVYVRDLGASLSRNGQAGSYKIIGESVKEE